MLPKFALMSLMLLTTQAYAFDTTQLGQLGSLTPEEKEALFAMSPKLESEAKAEMAKLGKNIEQVFCDGMRFPGAWKELGGLRVSPYVCQFGDNQWLLIRTRVVVTGKGGKVIQLINREAMQQATDVKETDPTWAWMDKEPAGR